MKTTKRNGLTIKNFGSNKGAMINYYNNVKNKDYVKFVFGGFNCKEKAYCVEIVYK